MSDQTQATESLAPTRDQLKAAIFAKAKASNPPEPFTFYGQQVELRRPNLNAILSLQSEARGDAREATLNGLIMCVFVPGSNEALFTDDDKPMLLELPFDDDATKLLTAIGDMVNVKVGADQIKNSDATLSAS